MSDKNGKNEIRNDLVESTEEEDISVLADMLEKARLGELDIRLVGYSFAVLTLLRSEVTFNTEEIPLWQIKAHEDMDKLVKSFEFEDVLTGFVLGLKKHLSDREFYKQCEAFGIDNMQEKYSYRETDILFHKALAMYAGNKKIRRYMNRLFVELMLKDATLKGGGTNFKS